MERKLHPGVRSTQSVARYARPAVVATRNRVMDVVTPVQPVLPKPAEVVPPQRVAVAMPVPKPANAPYISDVVQAAKPHRSVTKPFSPIGSPEPSALTRVEAHVDAKQVQSSKPTAAESLEALFAAPDPEPAAPAHMPAVATPEPVSAKSKRSGNRKRFSFRRSHLLYGMASLVFIVGMYVAIDGWLVNRAASTQTEVLAAQAADPSNDRDNLTEDKPSGTSTYKVAPDLPRVLQIPSIGVNARVLQLGVKSNNELATPSNIYDAGWYTGSSKPTDRAGAILIDGHVSGPTKHGVFYNLKKLKAGDEMILERGDGEKLTFVVTRSKTVKTEEVDMGEMMRSDEPTKLALNLITCGGVFDAKNNEFESRVLVFAVQK